MSNLSGHQVFSLNPDANLHGSPSGPVHTGLEGKQIPQEHRTMEIQPVYGNRNGIAGSVPGSHDIGCIVDQLHYCAAMHITGGIRISRQHDLSQYHV